MHVDLHSLTLCAWLLTYALHSTLIIAAAWMSSAVLARIGRLRGSLSQVRERLWKLALVGGIATATVQTALGGGPWSLVAESESAQPAAPSETIATLPASSHSLPYAAPVFLDPASFRQSLDAIRRASRTRDTQGATPASSRATPALESSVPTLYAAPPAVLAPAPQFMRANYGANRDSGPAAAEVASATLSATDAESVEPALPRTVALSRTWIRGLLGLWIAGVLFGIVRWTLDWRRLGAALRGRTRIGRGPAREVFDALVLRTGVGAHVRLVYAPQITAPITIGFLRPAICLPPRAECELQQDELEALLAHELAHALRRDPAWLCACRAIEVVLFFQPLNRWARVQLADEAEYLCDDWAVRHTRERLSLASCLTEIAGWIVGRPLEIGAPGMAARGSRLELRVRRVLEGGDRRGAGAKALRWLSPLACGAVGAVALFVPGVSAKSVGDEADLLAREDVASPTHESAEAPEASTTRTASESDGSMMASNVAPSAVRAGAASADGADEKLLLALELQALAANPFLPFSRATIETPRTPALANALIAPDDESSSKAKCAEDTVATRAPHALSTAPSAPANMLQMTTPSILEMGVLPVVAAEELADARAEGLAFEAEVSAIEESLRALKTELSRRHAPPELSRRMKALEGELRTLQKRRGELSKLMSLPALRVVAPDAPRTDDHLTNQR